MKHTDPGQLCGVCQGRLDSVLWSAGRHPGCGVAPRISDAAEAQLIGHLAVHLGAVEIEPTSNQGDRMTQPTSANRDGTPR